MTHDEIIRMAREAGFLVDNALFLESVSLFERFAALVAAHEREKQAEQTNRIVFDSSSPVVIDYSGKDYRIEAAVLAEREACAKVCDELGKPTFIAGHDVYILPPTPTDCAAAIRARGN